MALKLVVQISKKIPGPVEYSSVQASCSIESEIAMGQDAAAESARLYGQAESAVDRQLGILAPVPTPVHVSPSPPPSPSFGSRPYTASGAVPYPSSGARRAPAPISAAQIRFLRQLLDRTSGAQERILAEHRVASIEALSSRAASGIIDQLKAVTP